MANDIILISQSEGIATLTLNRPDKRNAMNAELIRALAQALQHCADDKTVRVVMITGNGEHFCAGADIAWMQKIAVASQDENYDDAQLLADLMYQLHHFPKPTLVLAQGTTLGGGLGLLSACDIALAAENAIFGFSEVKIGIAPSIVSPYVIAAIGERVARYYFLTGERFDAKNAYRIGLVHQVTKADHLLATGKALAHTLLENSPHAMEAVKQLIRYVTAHDITEDLSQKTAQHLAEMRATTEAQEGLKAFLEKRKPKWNASH